MKIFWVCPTTKTRTKRIPGPAGGDTVKRLWQRFHGDGGNLVEDKWCDEWAPANEFGGGALFYSDISCTLPYGDCLYILMSNKVRWNLDQRCACGKRRFEYGTPSSDMTVICCEKHPVVWRLENGELTEA